LQVLFRIFLRRKSCDVCETNMTENISNLIVAAASLCGGIVVAIIAGLTIWTFRDIRSRTRDIFVQILAPVLVAVIPIAGILVYLMLRPRETLAEQYVRALEEESLLSSIENQEFCPTCGRRVEGEMQFCPSCHSKLRNACGNCGRAVHLSWDLCPYCGNGLVPEAPVAKVSKPATKAMPAPQPQKVAAPQTQQIEASKQPSGFTAMLDKMGGAVAGAIDKVTPKSNAPQSDLSDQLPAQNGNATPPPKPPAKKPPPPREELE
jgi:RNA polymerase subunit RPABC4/transcription elongation factor Spt4